MEEMHSLMKNNTWVLVKRPQGARVMVNKYISKYKEGIVGVELGRFKAIVVA